MTEILRNTPSLTTETLLLFLSLLCITLAKVFDESRFQSFISLLIHSRHLKHFSKEPDQTQHWFSILMFIPQLIVFALTIQFSVEYFLPGAFDNVLVLISFLGLFILFKYYLEKTIATVFDIQQFAESFQFHKLTYRNFSALILLPLLAFYTYSDFPKNILIIIILALFVLLNLISSALTLINHQKNIGSNMFYFILYLCALEIAPYLMLFQLLFLDKA